MIGNGKPSASPTMDLKALPIRILLEYFLTDTSNDDAWREFDRRVRPVIEATVFKSLAPSIRAAREDIVQNVFCKLIDKDYQRLRNMHWPHEDAIFALLRVISYHTVIDWVRPNNIPFVPLDSPEATNIGDGKDCHKELYVSDLRRRIDRYLLSRTRKQHFERDRTIFWLFYRRGYTDKSIAGLPGVNLSPKNVENIRRQLLREVKRELNAQPPVSEDN